MEIGVSIDLEVVIGDWEIDATGIGDWGIGDRGLGNRGIGQSRWGDCDVNGSIVSVD